MIKDRSHQLWKWLVIYLLLTLVGGAVLHYVMDMVTYRSFGAVIAVLQLATAIVLWSTRSQPVLSASWRVSSGLLFLLGMMMIILELIAQTDQRLVGAGCAFLLQGLVIYSYCYLQDYLSSTP